MTVDEYVRAYNQENQRLSQQFRRALTQEEMRLFGVDQRVLSQLLNGAALDGEATRLGLSDVAASADDAKPLKYSFRYFQDLKAALVLPEDFEPERVHVTIKTKGKSSKTVEEFFIWEVKPG